MFSKQRSNPVFTKKYFPSYTFLKKPNLENKNQLTVQLAYIPPIPMQGFCKWSWHRLSVNDYNFPQYNYSKCIVNIFFKLASFTVWILLIPKRNFKLIFRNPGNKWNELLLVETSPKRDRYVKKLGIKHVKIIDYF